MPIAYSTDAGVSIKGLAETVLESDILRQYKNKIDLVFTSPPFPLNRKKRYGNRQGQDYIDWLSSFAPKLCELMSPTGSIVIEVGNSWVKGEPAMSTLALQSLLKFMEKGNLVLCQQFIWNNPAKLPSPAQWVNVERIRMKDSFTHLWWFSTTSRPKANNRNVLVEYSDSMKKLLNKESYNAGSRPSEHQIGDKSFLKDNKGAIPSNVITIANTNASTPYLQYCREHDIKFHPARMPLALAEFFIKFMTDPGDIVMDPFAGSNTTGAAAEKLDRRWISIEADETYIQGSKGWFDVIREED